jgi:hypothetical protein
MRETATFDSNRSKEPRNKHIPLFPIHLFWSQT